MIKQRILGHFQQSAELKMQAAAALAAPIAAAVELMFTALSNGNRIFACGDGGSAAECRYFAAQLVGCFERERLPLPAMALTTDCSIMSGIGQNDEGKAAYARQIQAFGQSGDVLLVMSVSGNAPDVVAAMEAAFERDMRVVAVTGKGGGVMASFLSEADVSICVPHDRSARIREVNSLIIHCLCDGIDVALFGGDAE